MSDNESEPTLSETEEILEEETENAIESDVESVEDEKVEPKAEPEVVAEPPVKAKKPRTQKQIDAFARARAALNIKRDLLKKEKLENKEITKIASKKSRKLKKISSEVKEVIEDKKLMTEMNVIEIIRKQKELRKNAKHDARKLLGITSDKPVPIVKKTRKKRVAKPKPIQQQQQEVEPREDHVRKDESLLRQFLGPENPDLEDFSDW